MSFRFRNKLLYLLEGALLLCVVAWGGWEIAVRFVSVPQAEIDRWTPSVRFYDAADRLVHVQLGYDYRWNFPVEYSEIPPELIRYVLAVEDRNFWVHDGFDQWAAIRAARQMLWNWRILSGASTITMQTVTMFTGRKRTIPYKIRQILLARNFELTHTKEEILTLYFNNLPFGGQIYGVEAAALYYFGRHIGELNRAELVLLAGLPQSPSRLRPDRHPIKAVQRRDVVLHLLVRNGAMTATEADDVRHETLRYRQFNVPFWPQVRDTHYFQVAQKTSPGLDEYHLALDTDLQHTVLTALQNARTTLPRVKDGAAVVVENATGCIRSLVGTMDFDEPVDGAVNAAIAWRSPGSAFKPFLYGEAIYAGYITEDTVLSDDKLLLPDYRPENFSGIFRGEVTATEALSDSLNTPAVRVLRQLGVPRALELLSQLGVVKENARQKADRIGLSLAIGGTETNLLALTQAYARLAGVKKTTFFSDDGTGPAKAPQPPELWTAGTRAMLLKMMRRRTMPGAGGLEVAWKTGTSNGNRDAWCFAVTPEWTVGIWFGNKSGEESPALVGATAAAPVAGAILQAIFGDNVPQWQESPELLQTALCAKTGLAPSAECNKTTVGTCVKGIPLAVCPLCAKLPDVAPLKKSRVLSPAPGTYLCNQGDRLQIQLDTIPEKVHLYVDGEYHGIHTTGAKIHLTPGAHQITVWGGEGWEGSSLSIRAK